jgi:hypothetical protein
LKPVELFHIGPQKSGHTWIYRCLLEHPQIASPAEDCIYYFDMFYSRGRAWYEQWFAGAGEQQKLFDPTCTYLRSPWAPRRIARENPDARIALCMRDPIERAFSHYWQEKKRNTTTYDFDAVLSNYDLFSSWLETGFYAEHIERFLEHFPREQILCQRFEDLSGDPERFLTELLAFYGVDTEFRPAEIHDVVNEASPRWSTLGLGANKLRRGIEGLGLRGVVERSPRLSRWLSGKSEYVRGIPDDLHARLLEICEPEIERLEKLLDIDLAAWRERTAQDP